LFRNGDIPEVIKIFNSKHLNDYNNLIGLHVESHRVKMGKYRRSDWRSKLVEKIL
jgi:hypothetical protein